MWQMAAYLALDVFKGHYAERSVKVNNRFRAAMARAERTVRNSQNVLRASVSSAAARRRSQQNQEILKAAGNEKDVLLQNVARLGNVASRGKLNSRLQAAEELGALAAAAGSAGIGGGSTSMIASTMELRRARMEEQIAGSVGEQRDAVMKQFDNVMIRAAMGMDTTTDVAGVTAVPITAQQEFGQGSVGVWAGAIANTFFRGPQAETNRQMFTDAVSSFKTKTVENTIAEDAGSRFNFAIPSNAVESSGFGSL